jgi:outer membrane lipoprotein-sorting protein
LKRRPDPIAQEKFALFKIPKKFADKEPPMISNTKILAVASLAVLLYSGQLMAQGKPAMTGLSIMEKTEKKNRAADEIVEASMKIFEKKTLMKERSLTMSVKSAKNYEDRSLFRFNKGDIRGTGFLTHQHGRREDDQWIYLPATKKIKRLASAERKESFVGSDFAYEDLRTENLYSHDYKYLGTKNVKAINAKCYLVEARPKSDDEKQNTGYSKRIFWISTDYLVRRVDYYSKDGEKKGIVKTQFFNKFTNPKSYKGFHRPSETIMIDKKNNTRTIFMFGDRKINEGVKDDTFSERQLKRS